MNILELFRFQNIDLLTVGVALAASLFLGGITYFNDRRSITHQTFFLFSIFSACWSTLNYLTYQFPSDFVVIWVLRLSVFFAVLHSFALFQLFYVFPKPSVQFSKLYRFGLVPLVLFTAILNLTPFVFRRVLEFDSEGKVSKVLNGPGLPLFAVVTAGLTLLTIIFLLRKLFRSSGETRRQVRVMFFGVILSFVLILLFNLVLPAFYNDARFISLGAVFTFPFIAFTAYSILKHHMLNVKIIAAEALVFTLSIVTFAEVVVSKGVPGILFRSGVFLLVLAFGALLIRSVRREVEQREKLEVLTRELSAANERLRELDKVKSEFLSFASHQVKSPMSVVKGYATLIYDGTYGPVSEKIRGTADKIRESADRMIALVNNLLSLRRIEEGKMDYAPEPVVLQELVSSIADEFNMLAEEKGLQFSFSSSVGEARASVDTQKFRQVIQNLIDNSIKYTERGWVKVSLDVDKSKKFLVVSVADSGRGIPKELLPKLFQQFSRDSSVAKMIQGTGLGLYIVRQIVEAHQGRVWVESLGEGQGSIFYVAVPMLV